MGTRLKFYFNQGIGNIRNCILIILAFSITLSLIAGIGYYSDSYQKYMFNEEFTQVVDFEIVFYEETYDVSKALGSLERTEAVESLINEREDSTAVYYGLLESRSLQLYNQESNTSTPFSLAWFSDHFYQSQRFSDYFSLEKGEFPSKPGDILIDIAYAQILNLDLSENKPLIIRADRDDLNRYSFYDRYDQSTIGRPNATYLDGTYFGYDIDVNIVGFFKPKHEYTRITQVHLYSNFEENSDFINENIEYGEIESSFIFTYHDFKNQTNPMFFEDILYNMDFFCDESPSTKLAKVRHGIASIIDRTEITVSNLNSYTQEYGKKNAQLEIQINQLDNSLHVKDYLVSFVISAYKGTEFVRSVLTFMKIPLIVASMFLGSFARKTEIKARLKEFLLLKSKGVPGIMIGNLFVIESLIIATISTVLGLLSGFGTFFIFKMMFKDLMLINQFLEFKLIVSWDAIISTYLYGLLLTFVGSILSILFILKIPISKLLSELNSNELDVMYDENSLFGKKRNNKEIEKNSSADDGQDPEKSHSKPSQNHSGIKSVQALRSKMQQSTQSYPYSNLPGTNNYGKDQKSKYYDPLKRMEKKRIRFSYILIICSILPHLLYLSIYIGKLSSSSDLFLRFAQFLETNIVVLSVIIIVSPVLLVWGILRILLKENPRFLARISKSISSLFIKDKSFLVGLEMVRRKQYRTVILIIGIFTSLFGFSNLYLNSMQRHEKICDNLEVGADFSGTLLSSKQKQLNNMSEIQELENQILNYSEGGTNNTKLVNNIVSCYYPQKSIAHDLQSIYFDFEKYFDIVNEDSKMNPIKDFQRIQTEIISYNNDPNLEFPGVIVNENFLQSNLVEVGDLYNHTFFYLDSTNQYSSTISVKIVAVVSILPGLYNEFDNSQNAMQLIAVDPFFFNLNDSIRYDGEIHHLIDSDPIFLKNRTNFENMLADATNGYYRRYSESDFYNLNWDQFTLSISVGILGIYNVLYIDFILVGIMIAIGLALLIVSLERENKHFNGILLSRGYGKKGILGIVLCELIVMFSIGIFVGLICGFLYSSLFVYISDHLDVGKNVLTLPLYINAMDIFGTLGSITSVTLIVSGITFLIESKLNISRYFKRF